MPVKLSNKLLLLATVLFALFCVFRYSGNRTTFHGDSAGYYKYLPSTFIYHNLVSYAPLPLNNGIRQDVLFFNRVQKDDKGNVIFNQYTYGIALMEAPFFLLAHGYELTIGGHANGYSDAYNNMVRLSALAYALLGLILVYKILKRYFGEGLATMGTITVYMGTNLFWFSIFQAGMSHVPLFFLYALLMLLTIKVHERPRTVLFVIIGLVIGMITIIRPTDIICIAIPLFYNIYNLETLKAKLLFIREHIRNLAYLILAFIIPLVPQFVYWKVLTGNFLYYSYRDQSFDWAHPKIIEGLFHFSNGWLPYSPIMIFALLGLVLFKYIKQWAWCIWLLLPAYVYIIYCWYCYRYINGLGSRPMIHLYPLLAVPLTAFIQFLSLRKLWLQLSVGAIALFFISLNLNYSYQQMKGILWSEESNIAFNMQMLYRTELRYEDLVVNDVCEWQPDTGNIAKICTIATERFDDSTSEYTQPDPISGNRYVYHLRGQEYPLINLIGKYDSKKCKNAKWIKCSGRFMYTSAPEYYRHMMVVTIPDKLWKGCRIENKTFDWRTIPGHSHLTLFDYEINRWGKVYFFVKLPDNIADGDEIKLFGWSLDKTDLYMDDLTVELYK